MKLTLICKPTTHLFLERWEKTCSTSANWMNNPVHAFAKRLHDRLLPVGDFGQYILLLKISVWHLALIFHVHILCTSIPRFKQLPNETEQP